MKLLVYLYLAMTPFVLANGGGYHYGVDFTGGIAPFCSEGTEHIQIMDEQLDIRLGLNEAAVKVVYQMKNTSSKKQKVKFGFPVENVKNTMGNFNFGQPDHKDTQGNYCKNYVASLNAKALKAVYLKEPFAEGKVKPFEGSEVLQGIEGWQVSEMTLKAHEEFELTISYDSVYDLACRFVSDDISEGPWLFKYRFSSGAVWKDNIKKGQVRIHMQTLDSSGVKVVKPVNRYKRDGNIIKWNFEDLDPTLADDLVLQVRPHEQSFSLYSGDTDEKQSYLILNENWYLDHQRFEVTSSSSLPQQGEHQYSAENIKGYGEKVWSEGAKGSGIGESLSFKFKTAQKVSYINIGGFYWEQDRVNRLYKANNRIKSFELLINGKATQTCHLADEPELQRILLNYKSPVKTIKLTIKDVYRGEKFDDTCVSSVSFLTPLKKKPKTYGAR